MKTKLFLISLLASFWANAQTTPIADFYFEQYLVDQGFDTNGMNGNILDSDAQVVTSLDMTGINITNLSGIEAFTNLTHIYCVSCNLTTVDLSNNPNINTINLRVNYNLSSFTFPTVATNLFEVNLSGCNLSSLTLPSATTIRKLYIDENPISSIDLSNSTSLQQITANNCNLNGINITNLYLSRLELNNNPIGSINLSGQMGLGTLKVSNCNLNSLNLTDCDNSLSTIECAYNNLNTLDLTNQTNIYILDCRNNNLTSLVIPATIKKLYASNNNIANNLDLSNSSDLIELDLYGNDFQKINLAGDNDSSYTFFDLNGNPNLDCVQVNDPSAMITNGWDFYISSASFSTDCYTLSSNTFAQNTFTLYPNPVENQFTISSNNNEEIKTIKIYNIQGQLVKTELNSNTTTTENLTPGFYLAKLTSYDGKEANIKFLKK